MGAATSSRGGFTLVESLLASVVLAMTVAAITVPFSAAARSQSAQARRSRADALCAEMMEEVLTRPFLDPDAPGDPGPDSGESTRDRFDNIDDYHGYAESAGELEDAFGEPVDDSAAGGLSRYVTADYVYISGQDGTEDPDFIRVTVTVRHGEDTLAELTRLVHSVDGGYSGEGGGIDLDDADRDGDGDGRDGDENDDDDRDGDDRDGDEGLMALKKGRDEPAVMRQLRFRQRGLGVRSRVPSGLEQDVALAEGHVEGVGWVDLAREALRDGKESSSTRVLRSACRDPCRSCSCEVHSDELFAPTRTAQKQDR